MMELALICLIGSCLILAYVIESTRRDLKTMRERLDRLELRLKHFTGLPPVGPNVLD